MPPLGRARLRLALALAGVCGAALVGGHWAGGGAVTAAEAPGQTLQLAVRGGESLRAQLRQAGLGVADANGASFAVAELIDGDDPPRGLGLALSVERSSDGDGLRLIRMDLARQGQTVATVTRAADGSFRLRRAADAPMPARAEPETGAHEAPAVLQGPMEDVLYGDPGATSDAIIVLKAARLFARKLDLTRDIALGDQVRLVFTRRIADDGRVLGAGDLLYAEIDTRGGPTRFYRHQRAGEAEFVDDTGADFDHALLRTPLDRPRITSDFGMRLHPLLGYTRMHQGLDFGAPVGSAVVAAGDGVVEEVRWASGYGRWIKLRHSANLETGYGHLSAWAPGLRPGAAIRQGQLIGYVGSSGLSTGPHLHYEVLEAGRAVDPKGLQPAAAPMRAAERASFEQEKQRVATLLKRTPAGPPLGGPSSFGGSD